MYRIQELIVYVAMQEVRRGVIQSILENHEPGVQDDRQEDMAPHYERQGDVQRPIPPGDLPLERHSVGREDNHHDYRRETNHERQLEVLPDTRNFDPERRPLNLLDR